MRWSPPNFLLRVVRWVNNTTFNCTAVQQHSHSTAKDSTVVRALQLLYLHRLISSVLLYCNITAGHIPSTFLILWLYCGFIMGLGKAARPHFHFSIPICVQDAMNFAPSSCIECHSAPGVYFSQFFMHQAYTFFSDGLHHPYMFVETMLLSDWAHLTDL